MADIVLKWKGEEYRIPEDRAFAAGAALEEVVSLQELQGFAAAPKFFKIAMGLGVLYRFAGCKVSDADIKREIDRSMARAVSDGISAEDAEEVFAVNAMAQLMAVLFDGAEAGDGAPMGEAIAS